MPSSPLATTDSTRNKLKISYTSNRLVIDAYKEFKEVKIFDISGELIKTIKSNKNQLLIENNLLNHGVNIISVIFANEMINVKVISK